MPLYMPSKSMVSKHRSGKHDKKHHKRDNVKISEVKSIIQKEIQKDAEHKIAAPYNAYLQRIRGYGRAGATVFTMFDMTSILSAITQGTGQGDRLANRITPVSYKVKGNVYIGNAGAPFLDITPLFLRMVLFRTKASDAVPTNLSDFLQNGNTDTFPLNVPADIWRKINTDKYKVYHSKVYKLASSTSTASPNNDFSLSKFFSIDLKKCVGKHIQWDDATAQPVNTRIMMGFLLSYYDGTVIGVANEPAVNINYDVELVYTDE